MGCDCREAAGDEALLVRSLTSPVAAGPLDVCVSVCALGHVRLFAPRGLHGAPQALPSMEFSRQEHWSGLPSPPPGDLPHRGLEPGSRVSSTGRRDPQECVPTVKCAVLVLVRAQHGGTRHILIAVQPSPLSSSRSRLLPEPDFAPLNYIAPFPSTCCPGNPCSLFCVYKFV